MPDQSLTHRGSVDSHCHLLSIEEKGLDARQLLCAATDGGLAGVVDVGIYPGDFAQRMQRFKDQTVVRFSSGLHPSQVERADRHEQISLLSRQVAARDIVAIGEIGLDYYWDTGERSDQIELFEQQIILAVKHDLPVIIHNRDADEVTLDVLRRLRPRGVMHCFSQDSRFCKRCLDLGMYISFGGNVTFKRSEYLRTACRTVPDERLLVETDSPYLSPHPVRGRTNHPGHLGFTIAFVAKLRGQTADDVVALTRNNAARLFGVNSWSAD